MDRLDKEEIIEVIRLIRNTANFGNFFFVVAYDRNYIVTALKDLAPNSNTSFLEKIFQLEVTLPYYRRKVHRASLLTILKKLLPEETHVDIDRSISNGSIYDTRDIYPWFENLRDVTRYANSLALNYTHLKGDVEFYDFLRLELVRVKHPSIHKLLFAMPDTFLSENTINGNAIFQLKKEGPDATILIKRYLNENFEKLSIPQHDIAKIVNLLSSIFSGSYIIPENSVVFPSKFERYSAYALLEGELSTIEFNKVRSTLDQTEFNAKIEEWVSNGAEFDLSEKMESIRNFDNKKDFELILKGIFHLKSLNSRIISGSKASYNDERLIQLISHDSVKNLFSGDEYKNFLLQVLKEEKPNYLEKSRLLGYITKGAILSDIPLTADELIDVLVGYLEHHCNTSEKWDEYNWELFRNTAKIEEVVDEKGNWEKKVYLSSRSKEILRGFIREKGLDGFISDVIFSQSEGKYTIQTYVQDIYEDSWESFETFIFEEDETKWQYLNEFKLFFQKFKSANYEEVEFDFKNIPTRKQKDKSLNLFSLLRSN